LLDGKDAPPEGLALGDSKISCEGATHKVHLFRITKINDVIHDAGGKK